MAGVVPDDEPLSLYLAKRERELVQRSAAIRGQLVPIERELADVRKAMDALGFEHGSELSDLMATAEAQKSIDGTLKRERAKALTDDASETTAIDLVAAVAEKALTQLTIKQMILSALRDHFHDGATPTELSEYMQNAYARAIDRNSISPQLGRLREEGMVDMLNNGKWKLSRQGIGIMRYGNSPARRTIAGGADMTLGDILHTKLK
jgi:hypothetical protein